jgi:molybdopterin synthase sulfur carrier subunit
MPRVLVPPPLHAYTSGRAAVTASGGTLGEIFADLDARHPGIRFRIVDEQDRVRPHIWIFVAGRMTKEVTEPVRDGDEVQIVAALSGG